MKWYENADEKSSLSTESQALVIPQPRQGIPVTSKNTHPNGRKYSITVYSAMYKVIAILSGALVNFFKMSSPFKAIRKSIVSHLNGLGNRD